jgi:hypothetical protein
MHIGLTSPIILSLYRRTLLLYRSFTANPLLATYAQSVYFEFTTDESKYVPIIPEMDRIVPSSIWITLNDLLSCLCNVRQLYFRDIRIYSSQLSWRLIIKCIKVFSNLESLIISTGTKVLNHELIHMLQWLPALKTLKLHMFGSSPPYPNITVFPNNDRLYEVNSLSELHIHGFMQLTELVGSCTALETLI